MAKQKRTFGNQARRSARRDERKTGSANFQRTPLPEPPPTLNSKAKPKPQPAPQGHSSASSSAYWMYGIHAARAALANPKRKIRRAVLTERAADELKTMLKDVSVEMAASDSVARLAGSGSVHQGVALLCEPLASLDLDTVLEEFPVGRRIVAVLDQVTDPHNEGAILRSAAAFGVAAVVVQDRHAATESGALAKAASGALDRLARVTVVNIARTLEDLGRLGFWRVALAGDGDTQLGEAFRTGDVALALGAEGSGLRRLVRERCDTTAFIPTAGASLNVSNAAAIAFYEVKRNWDFEGP